MDVFNDDWASKSTAFLDPDQGISLVYNTQRATFQALFTSDQIDADLPPRKCITQMGNWFPKSNTGFKRFPFDNFTYYLTLFSKFFSSFPHGTCSLSVSRQYLALDGIYHPFWSAFPNKPTLWDRITKVLILNQRRDSHPLWCLVPKNLCPSGPRKRLFKLQFAQEACEISNLSSSRFTRRY
jgi:hypothetical protein